MRYKSLILAFVISTASLIANSRDFVLTGNPGNGEYDYKLSCSYTANPPFSNPKDRSGRNLIDSDKPSANWHTTTGINKAQQTLVFDLQLPCKISSVTMLFDRPEKPKSVTVFIGSTSDGPWKKVGEMLIDTQKKRWWQLKFPADTGQFVKFDCRINKWGWYLREVKIYGCQDIPQATQTARIDQGKLLIVDKRQARCALVVPDEASTRTMSAAMIFQKIARQMTGVNLPLVKLSEFKSQTTPIYIGDSPATRKLGIKVLQRADDGDHYIIQRGDNYLALVGNDAPEYGEYYLRGTVYAVYDFFERLGCGWYGPDPLWQVIPETQNLVVPDLDIDERPAFLSRRMWMHGMKSKELRDAWREGGIAFTNSHAYYKLVPPGEFKKDHPEWFGKGQPDITNPEVIKMVISKLRKKLDKTPAPFVVPFSFVANDAGGYVSNSFTKKIGNISSQQLYFANEVAKGLSKTHRGRFVLDCLAYWHSHKPPEPMRKVEPGVRITIVNEGNHTKPLDIPESSEIIKSTSRNNTRESAAIEGWKKTGGLLGIYEWYIPAAFVKIWADIPWYPGELTLRNLRFWYSKGIRMVYYEAQREKNGGFPLRWPVYYQCYRGMWNPKLTTEEIMSDACKKLFGPAAQAIMNYYNVFEKAMLKTKITVGNWNLPSPERVYTPELESMADKWIEMAKNIAEESNDENIKKRVDEEMRLWNIAKSALAKLRKENKQTYKVIFNGKSSNYGQREITKESIISLFGLSDDAKIDVIEQDGQNRRLKSKEKIDLLSGVVFKTVK